MQSTFERLVLILARDYQVDATRVLPESTLEDLNIDSLGATELLFTIEDEFHVKVTREPVELRTVEDVVAFIEALIAKQIDLDGGSASSGSPAGTA